MQKEPEKQLELSFDDKIQTLLTSCQDEIIFFLLVISSLYSQSLISSSILLLSSTFVITKAYTRLADRRFAMEMLAIGSLAYILCTISIKGYHVTHHQQCDSSECQIQQSQLYALIGVFYFQDGKTIDYIRTFMFEVLSFIAFLQILRNYYRVIKADERPKEIVYACTAYFIRGETLFFIVFFLFQHLSAFLLLSPVSLICLIFIVIYCCFNGKGIYFRAYAKLLLMTCQILMALQFISIQFPAQLLKFKYFSFSLIFGDLEHILAKEQGEYAYPMMLIITAVILIASSLWLKIPKISDLRNKNIDLILYEVELDQKVVIDESERDSQYNLVHKIIVSSADENNRATWLFRFSPWLNIWIARIAMFAISYIYHSYQSLFHLTWLLFSFILPLPIVFVITIFVMLPTMVIEYFLIYIANIPNSKEAVFIPQLLPYDHLYFKLLHPQYELVFIYIVIIMFCMMISGRKQLLKKAHNLKDYLVRKMKNPNSSVFWKFLFYFMQYVHIVVLAFLLYMGMKESFQSIGYMLFFIIYSSSNTLYRKTNVLLIIFTSFFIWGQYFYTLQFHLTKPDADQSFLKILEFIDWKTDDVSNDTKTEYFYYSPNIKQYGILIMMVMLNLINTMFMHKEEVKELDEICSELIYEQYPKASLIFVRTKYIIQQILVIFILILLVFIEVTSEPTLINWGFVIISLIFLWIILVGKQNQQAYKRCSKIALWLKRYSGFMLFLSVTYFLLTKQTIIDKNDYIMKISDLIGLKSYKDESVTLILPIGETEPIKIVQSNISYIWDYFYSYLVFLFFGGFLEQYYKTQAYNSSKEAVQDFSLKTVFENAKELERYHETQRLSLVYLIYRIRNAWRIIDPIALYFHVIANTAIIYIAINDELSLFMAIYLMCIVYFYLSTSIKLHFSTNKMQLEGEIDLQTASDASREFKKQATLTFLIARRKVWYIQYTILLLSVILLYPSALVKSKFDFSEKTILNMFWIGIYRSNKELSSMKVPFSLLIILILERIAYKWVTDRFGCTIKRIAKFKETRERLTLIKNKQELPEYEPLKLKLFYKYIPIRETKRVIQQIAFKFHPDPDREMKLLKKRIDTNVSRKANIKSAKALRVLVETICLALLAISAVFKANIISILYVLCVMNYIIQKSKIYPMLIVSILIGVSFAGQYMMALLNLSVRNCPQPLPEDEKKTGVFFPIIQYSDFLMNNINWAYYFAMGLEKLTTMLSFWVDFIALCVVTMYFLNFRNPVLNRKITKIKWCTQEYSTLINEEEDIASKDYSELNLDQAVKRYNDLFNAKYQRQAPKTASQRLLDIRKSNPAQKMTESSRYIVHLVMPLFTLVVVLSLALLNKALLSLGYVALLLPYLFSISLMLNQHLMYQDGKRWSFVKTVCFQLMAFAFLDFTLQIVFQAPWMMWLDYKGIFGLKRTWQIKEGVTYQYIQDNLNEAIYIYSDENLFILIMKCIIIAVLSLQKELFSSIGFKNFIEKEDKGLSVLMKMREYKRMSITYNFNNFKLKSLTQMNKQKQSILHTVKEVQEKIRNWKSGTTALLSSAADQQLIIAPDHSPKAAPKRNMAKRTSFLIEVMEDQDEEEAILMQDEHLIDQSAKEIVRKNKKHLPKCTRFLIWLNRKLTNQFLFMNDIIKIQLLMADTERGEKIMATQIEDKMLEDAKSFVRREGVDKAKDIKVPEDMPQIMELMILKNLATEWLFTFAKIIASNTHNLAYLFMIISMIQNAGLISLGYPLAVFGYALMEEVRPSKGFWRFILYYTLFVLFAKYAMQLEFFSEINDLLKTANIITKVGLRRYATTSGLIMYMIPEIIITILVLGHTLHEELIGLRDKNETQYEDIQQSIERIRGEIVEEEEDDRISYMELPNSKSTLDVKTNEEQKQKDIISKEVTKYIDKKYNNYSMVMDEEELKSIRKIIKKQKNKGFFQKSQYFQRIFPTMMASKPGKDYYFQVTFLLFIICIYILTYYDKVDQVQSESQSIELFDSQMVMFLFIHVCIIILERYIYRSEQKLKRRKTQMVNKDITNQTAQLERQTIFRKMTTRLQIPMSASDIRFDQTNLQSKDAGKILKNLEVEDYSPIEIEKSKITNQQIMKYILHWILLIFVHIVVFWYFPITGNYALYGQVDCPKDTPYGCRDFKNNGYLLALYIFYCFYFLYSASQIRYGMPLLRKSSSSMNDNDWSYIGHTLQRNLPFVMELKVILDWSFTKTSLELFQWFQLANYESDIYLCKMGNKSVYQKKLGAPQSRFDKICCGCFCTSLIMFFLFGPFIFFSDFGSFSALNPVTQSQFELNVLIEQGISGSSYNQSFNLYQSRNSILYPTKDDEYNTNHFAETPATKFFDRQQIQTNEVNRYSDQEWILADQNKLDLVDMFKRYKEEHLNFTQNETLQDIEFKPSFNISIQFKYEFLRNAPSDALWAGGSVTTFMNLSNPHYQKTVDQIIQVNDLKCPEKTSTIFQDVLVPRSYVDKIRLDQSKIMQQIEILYPYELAGDPYLNMTLRYACDNTWQIMRNDTVEEIFIFAFSANVVGSLLAGYSIMTFYTSVIFFISGYIRSALMTPTSDAFINEINEPEPILKLCECIHMMRHEKKLAREEVYYHMLVEILRSPELLRHLTGSSLKGELADKHD